MPSSPRAGVVAAYAALALVWGSSFLLITVALTGFDVTQVAVGRIVLGALTLVVLMVATRTAWPREQWLVGHLVVGVPLCLAPSLLFSWAGQHLPSGLSAILNATTPIRTALAVTAAVRSERLTRGRGAGVGLGVVGVAVVMGLWRVVDDTAFASSLPTQAACLGATACYGAGFAWMRRFVTGRHAHGPLAIATGQVGSAAVLGLVLAGVLALGALGTGLADVWSTRVLVEWGSLAASSVTHLTPVVGVVGVVAGAAVLGEHLTWNEPVGTVVVVVSVLLAQGRLRLPRSVRGTRSIRPSGPDPASGA